MVTMATTTASGYFQLSSKSSRQLHSTLLTVHSCWLGCKLSQSHLHEPTLACTRSTGHSSHVQCIQDWQRQGIAQLCTQSHSAANMPQQASFHSCIGCHNLQQALPLLMFSLPECLPDLDHCCREQSQEQVEEEVDEFELIEKLQRFGINAGNTVVEMTVRPHASQHVVDVLLYMVLIWALLLSTHSGKKISCWCAPTGDIKKAKEGGFHTCQALLMYPKKRLAEIKGLSEAKIEKMVEAAKKMCVGFGWTSAKQVDEQVELALTSHCP